MRALDWSRVAIVCAALGVVGAACGGRLDVADCGPLQDFCPATDVCCPHGYTCGTGNNGCPAGGCCTTAAGPQEQSDGGGGNTGLFGRSYAPQGSPYETAAPGTPPGGEAPRGGGRGATTQM